MNAIKITVSDDGKKLIEVAAAKVELPVSLWARITLLNAARDATPRAVGRPKIYRMNRDGVECTKEEFDANEAEKKREFLAVRDADAKLRAEMEANNADEEPVKKMKFNDAGDPVDDDGNEIPWNPETGNTPVDTDIRRF